MAHLNPNPVCCIICRKQTSDLGISSHFRIVHEGKNDFILKGNAGRRGKQAWNKGLTAKTNPIIAAASQKISKTLSALPGRPHTEETKKKISQAVKGKTGGYHKGSGSGKSGWFKGFWCDSTWELAFLIWCLNAGKTIKRCDRVFEYSFNGVSRKYYPDFEVNGYIFEIKGRRELEGINAAKHKASNGEVTILLAKDMEPILESVKHLQPLYLLYENG